MHEPGNANIPNSNPYPCQSTEKLEFIPAALIESRKLETRLGASSASVQHYRNWKMGEHTNDALNKIQLRK